MTQLNSNQRGFISAMTKSEGAELDGFTILAKRDDAPIFFDALLSAGLLVPQKNQGPIPADKEGYVRIPYWAGLDYLDTVARISGEKNDTDLARKIIDVVISITNDANEEQQQNFHTWRKFAEAVSKLPIETITEQLLNLVPVWLESRFDRALAAQVLSGQLMPKLIGSSNPEHRKCALRLFDQLTELPSIKDEDGAKRRRRDQNDTYWVSEIIKNNVQKFASIEPQQTVALFRKRVAESFTDRDSLASWLERPAVENHGQNKSWHHAANYSVEGLRDALSTWIEADPNAAVAFIVEMFRTGPQIEKRVAVYLANTYFSVFKEVISEFLRPELLDINSIHESYNFLRERFTELSDEQQNKVIALIENISTETEPNIDGDQDIYYRQVRTWFSSVAHSERQDVRKRYQSLIEKFGKESEHPDFLSYHETSVGPGPSPFNKADLVSFLLKGTIVDELNAFIEQNSWRAPTRRALCDVLEEVIIDRPNEFLSIRNKFLSASRPYQHAYLYAYLRLWNNDRTRAPTVAWDTIWPPLLDWILEIIQPDNFWTEKAEHDTNLTPNRDWIISISGDLIQSITRDDAHAIPQELLPRVSQILDILLTRVPPQIVKETDDALTHVINSSRGKILEGLINYSLRMARLSDKAVGNHSQTWTNTLRPLFDREIARVVEGNDEFVVLFGQYIPQFQYLSKEWIRATIEIVFDTRSRNFDLAMGGFIYAHGNRSLYQILTETGILDAGLARTSLQKAAHEKLVELLAVSVLWGIESIDGPRINRLFNESRIDDLDDVASFFWQAHRDGLSREQAASVAVYWRRTVDWVKASKVARGGLISHLLSLVCYLDVLDSLDSDRLVWLIKNGGPDDRTWFVGEEFDRLASEYPDAIAKAMLAYIETSRPFYDHDKHLLNAAKKLVEKGFRSEVITISDRLSSIAEFKALYLQLREPG